MTIYTYQKPSSFVLSNQSNIIAMAPEDFVLRGTDFTSNYTYSGDTLQYKLPLGILPKVVANDGLTYILCQYRGLILSGSLINAPFTVSNNTGIINTRTSYKALVNINVFDIGGTDPYGSTPLTGQNGIFAGFIVNTDGTDTTTAGRYTATGYSVVLPRDSFLPINETTSGTTTPLPNTGTTVRISVGDFVWLQQQTLLTSEIEEEKPIKKKAKK